jgi:hypothetical protein
MTIVVNVYCAGTMKLIEYMVLKTNKVRCTPVLAIIAVFDAAGFKESYSLNGRAFLEAEKLYPDLKEKLGAVKTVIAYQAGRDGEKSRALALPLSSFSLQKNSLDLKLGQAKKLGVKSAAVGGEIYRVSTQNGWLNEAGHAPLLFFMPRERFAALCKRLKRVEQTQALMEKGDYKGVCMLYAPLRSVKADPDVWDNADALYDLGRACSKLSTTLLIKAGEIKKLEEARQYRDYCVAFLKRGTELEPDSARCATALAYRYYSNVHELMRPGERRDQDLGKEIENANEWLSRALEIYPQSIRNNYRKGKLIIEKQAPYLLFGKRAFGAREAELLREIREIGEEHLATAISLYEALEDNDEKERNRREYAKALFVLGNYYIDDAYLPVHEYYLRIIAGSKTPCHVQTISKLDLQTAVELLEKCYHAETDLLLDKIDTKALAAMQKEWTRAPSEKLYRLGCAYSGMAFVARATGEDAKPHAKKALVLLEAAKRVAESYTDRKHNTWHISEKIAWTHIYLGQYERAAKLLSRAKQGYIINTYAIALMLMDTKDASQKAWQALQSAARDRRNLASGLSGLLYAYASKKTGHELPAMPKTLSVKNARLAAVLGIEAKVKNP